MGVGDQRFDVVERVTAVLVARVLGRNDQIDAVGAVADLRFDPGEVDLELLGRMGDGAEHADPTGLGHCGHDITTVAEREDRELDAQHLGSGSLHVVLLGISDESPIVATRWFCRRSRPTGSIGIRDLRLWTATDTGRNMNPSILDGCQGRGPR